MSLIEQIERNKRKTKLLIGLFIILIGLTGLGVGFIIGLMFEMTYIGIAVSTISFLVIALIYTLVVQNKMSKMMLMGSDFIEVTEENDAQLLHIVEDMSMMADIPMPKVYLVKDKAPNAFASGSKPSNSMVAVTTGLREILTREELEGVVGHEVAHIMNYDTQLTSWIVSFMMFLVGTGSFLITMAWQSFRSSGSGSKESRGFFSALGIALLLSGIVIKFIGIPSAKLLQFAISREREFLADATSSDLTRNPTGLIRALMKIDGSMEYSESTNESVSILCISPKKMKKKKLFSGLYRTHPETELRIEKLNDLIN